LISLLKFRRRDGGSGKERQGEFLTYRHIATFVTVSSVTNMVET